MTNLSQICINNFDLDILFRMKTLPAKLRVRAFDAIVPADDLALTVPKEVKAIIKRQNKILKKILEGARKEYRKAVLKTTGTSDLEFLDIEKLDDVLSDTWYVGIYHPKGCSYSVISDHFGEAEADDIFSRDYGVFNWLCDELVTMFMSPNKDIIFYRDVVPDGYADNWKVVWGKDAAKILEASDKKCADKYARKAAQIGEQLLENLDQDNAHLRSIDVDPIASHCRSLDTRIKPLEHLRSLLIEQEKKLAETRGDTDKRCEQLFATLYNNNDTLAKVEEKAGISPRLAALARSAIMVVDEHASVEVLEELVKTQKDTFKTLFNDHEYKALKH